MYCIMERATYLVHLIVTTELYVEYKMPDSNFISLGLELCVAKGEADTPLCARCWQPSHTRQHDQLRLLSWLVQMAGWVRYSCPWLWERLTQVCISSCFHIIFPFIQFVSLLPDADFLVFFVLRVPFTVINIVLHIKIKHPRIKNDDNNNIINNKYNKITTCD